MPRRRPSLHIPPLLDRHLVSVAHTAALHGDGAAGAFDAVVEQVVHALRDQGASRAEVERALGDAFVGIGYVYARTPTGERYDALRRRAVTIARSAVVTG